MKPAKLFKFIAEHITKLKTKLIYSALLMFYAYKSPNTPAWARRTILGALAYLLSPIDGLPDLTPFIGFTDDMGVISFSLVTIACYIDKDVRQQARHKLTELVQNIDESELKSVDDKL
ncbi:MAG: DUF1232 domain-containing protein [Saprospiraceae bacterium]|nr:DUF1232 domain-containing protein [Saprospiraceae bacterium]